jgi:hypothetical protein
MSTLRESRLSRFVFRSRGRRTPPADPLVDRPTVNAPPPPAIEPCPQGLEVVADSDDAVIE